MQTSIKPYYLIFFSFITFAFSHIMYAQDLEFEQIESSHFHNLYKLNENLYRSEQPSKNGMKELENKGMLSIVNLRRRETDEKKLKNTDLNLSNLPLKAGKLNFDDIFNALQTIQQAEKPVLVHCWHGSDRTGAIIAASRMVFENWSKAQAIAEFTDKRFGYHKKMYPNLIPLLKSLDLELLKEKLAQ
ncbi:dual specificity protein phosphatase family protein [Formosa sp. L2A11]|uniref:dual specificity protein phosphatase family protein n=1 Tax=Formosa sp. L2A11 TaxID=2686363 RepID=UPI00131E2C76|nr:dual specificity protein phosphatase family protein [Formosa sp. L2A11]